ncbi:MAG: hypothetical protein IT289_10460 [Oligoflexia bacterium]|nr:hypothetical protein [Oligoflexia bacterium]
MIRLFICLLVAFGCELSHAEESETQDVALQSAGILSGVSVKFGAIKLREVSNPNGIVQQVQDYQKVLSPKQIYCIQRQRLSLQSALRKTGKYLTESKVTEIDILLFDYRGGLRALYQKTPQLAFPAGEFGYLTISLDEAGCHLLDSKTLGTSLEMTFGPRAKNLDKLYLEYMVTRIDPTKNPVEQKATTHIKGVFFNGQTPNRPFDMLMVGFPLRNEYLILDKTRLINNELHGILMHDGMDFPMREIPWTPVAEAVQVLHLNKTATFSNKIGDVQFRIQVRLSSSAMKELSPDL